MKYEGNVEAEVKVFLRDSDPTLVCLLETLVLPRFILVHQLKELN